MADKQVGQDGNNNYIARGFLLGLIFGLAWGVTLSAAVDNPAFLAIGIGSGISLGLAIGSSLQRRHDEQAGDAVSTDEVDAEEMEHR